MNRRIYAVWASIMILLSVIVIFIEITPKVEAPPTTHYVGGSNPGNYSHIQWAIDNASDGDTVFIYSGKYYENVLVNKTINLIGEDKDTTILNGSWNGDVINVVTDWVNITGFTVNESANWSGGGIHLDSVQFCNIFGNNASSNGYGIILVNSFNNTVNDNYCLYNTGVGIALYESNNNTITDNFCSYNSDGIDVYESHNNTVKNNNCSNNSWGIYIGGFWYEGGCSNTFENNELFGNGIGIKSNCNSNWNVFVGNIISRNGRGISLDYHSESWEAPKFNTFYHNNFINNTTQAIDSYDENIDHNWYHPTLLEGNYWSDYTGLDDGSGTEKHAIAGDGIGDTEIPHPDRHPHYIYDLYPLMEPYPIKPRPMANYTILKQGWNLISIPLVQEEQNLSKVLQSINTLYDAVQWFDITNTNDPWKHYKPRKPFGNYLHELNETKGFWIHINQSRDIIFPYNGTQPTSNQSITIYPGWNMVGYPSLINRTRDNALNNINFSSDVDAIWTLNASTQTWKEIGPTDYFELGRGYWIHSKVTKVWDVPL